MRLRATPQGARSLRVVASTLAQRTTNVGQRHRSTHVRHGPGRLREFAVGRRVHVADEEPAFGEFADERVELFGGSARLVDVGETLDDAFAVGVGL
jgi:hypothetical protein